MMVYRQRGRSNFRTPREAIRSVLGTTGEDLYRDAACAADSGGDVIEPAVRIAISLRILAGSSYLELM
jgi:hypothetical protein